MNLKNVAAIAHEANRMLCRVHGDDFQPNWEDASDWQKESAVNGVQFHLDYPKAGPKASHENWRDMKEATGWRYGEVKDSEAKTHPCMVLFDDLPPEQQAKDYLFCGIVHALAAFVPMSGQARET